MWRVVTAAEPQALSPDSRTEELSVCPRAVPANRTGGLEWVSTPPTWECLWMW